MSRPYCGSGSTASSTPPLMPSDKRTNDGSPHLALGDPHGSYNAPYGTTTGHVRLTASNAEC